MSGKEKFSDKLFIILVTELNSKYSTVVLRDSLISIK